MGPVSWGGPRARALPVITELRARQTEAALAAHRAGLHQRAPEGALAEVLGTAGSTVLFVFLLVAPDGAAESVAIAYLAGQVATVLDRLVNWGRCPLGRRQ